MRRSKSYLADKFLPPFDAPLESNLRDLFAKELSADETAESLLEIIPNLNHDQVIDLSLFLAFEAKINDKAVWRAIEDAAENTVHLMYLTQVCQLEWATNQLKPKQTTPRLGTLLMRVAQDNVDKCDATGLMHIM